MLITSRSPEPWLGDVGRITVGGLTPYEADEYAGYLLAPYPAAAPRRAKRAFGNLMEWLDGHPLSMRLILPHLVTVEPGVLLDALRGTAPLPGVSEDDGGRMTSLPRASPTPMPTYSSRPATLGISALEENWRMVTGYPLPPAVPDYIESNRPSANG